MKDRKWLALLAFCLSAPLLFGEEPASSKMEIEIEAMDSNPVLSLYEFTLDVPTKVIQMDASPLRPIETSASGHWNSAGQSWEEEFKSQLEDLKNQGIKITGQELKKDYFVITGKKGEWFYYEKGVLLEGEKKGEMDRIFLTFNGKYSASDRKVWEPIMKTCTLARKTKKSK
jgi:hypothetical protein